MFDGAGMPARRRARAPRGADVERARQACLRSRSSRPGDPRVGLVTGHRLPNTVGAGGIPLNEEVLRPDARRGDAGRGCRPGRPGQPARSTADSSRSPSTARFAREDTAYVARFPDRGEAMLGPSQNGCVVAVLHNAIRPHRSLAMLVAEVALDRMDPPDVADDSLRLNPGCRSSAARQTPFTSTHRRQRRPSRSVIRSTCRPLEHGTRSAGADRFGRPDRGARTLRTLSRPLFRPRAIHGRG